MEAKIGRIFGTYRQRVARDENVFKIKLGEFEMCFNKNFPQGRTAPTWMREKKNHNQL